MVFIVPDLPPISTKSPATNGFAMSSVIPENRFDIIFCIDSDSARPATLTSAISDVVGIPRLSATIMPVIIHIAALTTERMKPRSAPSSRLELASALSVSFVRSKMQTRQTASASTPDISLSSASEPIEIFDSSFVMAFTSIISSIIVSPEILIYMLPR